VSRNNSKKRSKKMVSPQRYRERREGDIFDLARDDAKSKNNLSLRDELS
jgi:hypothetical protein